MRLRIVVLIVLIAFGGAITLDRISPAAAPERGTLAFDPAGGVLTCPYFTEPDARASIQLANLSARPASVRISIPVQKAKTAVISVSLAPKTVKSVPAPDRTTKARSGAVIEYVGGTVVASHTLYVREKKGPAARGAGMAAAPCQGIGAGDVVVAYAGTLLGDATLALFNPGSANADVSVTLLSDGRTIQPVRLSRRLVPSHARRDFKIGDFAFNAQNVTAVVHANAGRVAAEALLRSNAGADLLPGQTPSSEVVAIAGQSGDVSTVGATIVGSDDTGLDIRQIGPRTQSSARGFPPSLPPNGSRVVKIPSLNRNGEAAFAIAVSVGSPVAVATRWVVRGRDGLVDFASLPALPAEVRWGAVIGAVGKEATERMIFVNPGAVAVTARVETISYRGTTVRTLTIPPGRLVGTLLGKGPGPFALLVDASGPLAVAVKSTGRPRGGPTTGTAVFATPLPPPRPIGAALDQRAGVPAILPTR